MKAEAHKLGHLGMDYLVRRSTLAEANIRRPEEFFASVYAYLLEKYAQFLADSNIKNKYNQMYNKKKKNYALTIRQIYQIIMSNHNNHI